MVSDNRWDEDQLEIPISSLEQAFLLCANKNPKRINEAIAELNLTDEEAKTAFNRLMEFRFIYVEADKYISLTIPNED